ncbi:MAG: GNAT family N-acetyltransferase [Rhizobiales bacterium]|nr:GNAT family N-acetyltransferase [Hyphomicrobiales bacterium]
MSVFSFRQYDAERDDEPASALWLRSWQKTYPDIDFAARLTWWREHWHGLVRTARITIAEAKNEMIGFVTVDPGTLYLDQIVVAPEYWGRGLASALIAEAKRTSPRGLDLDVNTDNARAVAFYRKEGFVVTGDGVNPLSGRPVHHMRWRP